MEAEATTTAAEPAMGFLVLYFALIALSIIAVWKLYTKAGKPGWASIIPIYNTIVLIEIAGKPIWWILLMFIPVVNAVVYILVLMGVAQNFGRGAGTAVGLFFLPLIFTLILAFGSAEYQSEEEQAPLLQA